MTVGRLIQAGGTTAEWEAADAGDDLVLPAGVWAYDSTADSWKWGNGIDNWKIRPYLGASIEPPPPVDPVASDTFYRNSPGSGERWGSASLVGGAWTGTNSAIYATSEAGGSGTGSATIATSTSSTSANAFLGSVSTQDIDMTMSWSVSADNTGGTNTRTMMAARRISANNEYLLDAYCSSSLVRLQFSKVVASVETAIDGTFGYVVVQNSMLAADTIVHMRMRLTGDGTTTLQGKAWFGSATEPSAWQIETTDTEATLQAPGGVGILISKSGTTAKTFSFYDLVAYPTS